MPNKITKIKSVNIAKFRGLEGVNINFGDRITVVCGKNGTSKSTILGIAAQMFNFETDYTTQPPTDLRNYKTLAEKPFSSQFREHFRLSAKHDLPNSMDVSVHVYDGAEDKDLTNLKLGLYLRSNHVGARATVRNNTKTNGASDSRKVTHPVIFLSLKRLTPITDRINYSEKEIKEFMLENKDHFLSLSSYVLGRRGAVNLTQTVGTINSMVASGESYDHQSVSVGEDNIGQILQAIFSFKKLKKDYADYHGGILLIDEIDAGLFPAAQRRLIEKLVSLAKELHLQIIITTHSPEIIDLIYKYSQNDHEKYKVVYLTNTYGALEAKENYSWVDIRLDLYNETKVLNENDDVEKVNVFFEDKENYNFYSALVTRRDIRAMLNPLKDINLGCQNFKQLLSKKIPGFHKSSIIVLDGDVNNIHYQNVVLLPTVLPPDQLIFEYLFNLDASDDFWKNPYGYNKDIFYERADLLINILRAGSLSKIDLVQQIKNPDKERLKNRKLRDVFKAFMKEEGIATLVEKGGVNFNPYRRWCKDNPILVDNFNSKFIDALRYVIGDELGANVSAVKRIVKK